METAAHAHAAANAALDACRFISGKGMYDMHIGLIGIASGIVTCISQHADVLMTL